MSTLILSVLVFGGAGIVVYRGFAKRKDKSCNCGDCDCPIQPNAKNK